MISIRFAQSRFWGWLKVGFSSSMDLYSLASPAHGRNAHIWSAGLIVCLKHWGWSMFSPVYNSTLSLRSLHQLQHALFFLTENNAKISLEGMIMLPKKKVRSRICNFILGKINLSLGIKKERGCLKASEHSGKKKHQFWLTSRIFIFLSLKWKGCRHSWWILSLHFCYVRHSKCIDENPSEKKLGGKVKVKP